MRINILFALQLTLAFGAIVSCSDNDQFLESLCLPVQRINPIDSLDLEQFGVFCPIQLFKLNRGFAINDASPKNDYAIVMVNPYKNKPEISKILQKGRGPGEIISPSEIIQEGSSLLVYDYATQKLIRVNFTNSQYYQDYLIDTVADYSTIKLFSTPYPVKNGFITPYYLDASWFALFERDSVRAFLKRPGFEVLKTAEPNFLMNYILNSHAVIDSSGERFCCSTLQSVAFSFSTIKEGSIIENNRYESIPPIISESGLAVSPDSPRGISAMASDSSNVYILYSGKPILTSSEVPSWECQHLLVFDWEGRPQKHYQLNHTVCSIAVEGNTIYCGTTYPYSRIIRYQL